MMTEQELIDLGFDKVEVLDDESQNGYDYYYYVLDLLPGLSLISSGNDESKDSWSVYNFDWINGDKITKASILHLKQVAVAQGYQGQHPH
jgi:hypothetical protein